MDSHLRVRCAASLRWQICVIKPALLADVLWLPAELGKDEALATALCQAWLEVQAANADCSTFQQPAGILAVAAQASFAAAS